MNENKNNFITFFSINGLHIASSRKPIKKKQI